MNTPRRPEVAVGAVVVRSVESSREVLLAQRANPPQQGRWSLPGGRVEWGESLHDAVLREVLEETGLHVELTKYLETVERYSAEFHYVIVDYEATPTDLDQPAIAASDAVAVGWFGPDDLAACEASGQLSDQLFEFLVAHGYTN
jgi:8-oxo-dGTP diphosphatase